MPSLRPDVVVDLRDFGIQFGDAGNAYHSELNSAFSQAATAGLPVMSQAGFVTVDDTVSTQGAPRFFSAGELELRGQEGWYNKALLRVNTAACRVENITVAEINASPVNSNKNQAANVGISVNVAGTQLVRCKSNGFCYPITVRNTSDISLTDCEFWNGYAWVEIDSVVNFRAFNSWARNCGLDGWKFQNENDTLCEGLLMVGCYARENGQRDLAAPNGIENTNGNGYDLYHGGYRGKLIGCRSYDNWGSAYNTKGGGSDPLQGQLEFIGCEGTGSKQVDNGSDTHGMEIGQGNGNGNANFRIIGGNFSGNSGDGIFMSGGFGHFIDGAVCINNGGDGLKIQSASKFNNIASIYCAGNGGANIRVGAVNNSSFVQNGTCFGRVIVSGLHEHNTSHPKNFDPGASRENILSDHGIEIASNVRDVRFDRVDFFWSQETGLNINGKEVVINDLYTYGAWKAAIQVAFGGQLTIRNRVELEETYFTGQTSFGAIYVPGGNSSFKAKEIEIVQSSQVTNSRALHCISPATIEYETMTTTNMHTERHGNGTINYTDRLEGTGSPVGSVVPRRVSDLYLDTSGNAFYRSYGLTNNDWQAL